VGGNGIGRARMDIGVVAQNVVRRDGQGQVTVELCRALVRQGHNVTVYAHRVDHELSDDVDTVIIPAVSAPQLIDDLAFLIRATRSVRHSGHDAVVTIGPTAFPRTRWLYHTQFSHDGWRATWTPSTRPPLPHRLHARIAGALERWSARRADVVIATTRQLAHETLGTDRLDARVAVASLGVDATDFTTFADRATARDALHLPPDAIIAGFLGGYATGRKGLDVLLDAMALAPTCEQLHLAIAGNGPAEAVRRRAQTLGIGAQVSVLGFADPRLVLAASDMVVVPSTYEPFSLVAVEAAAAGRPVVITACAGAAPIVAPGAIVVTRADACLVRDAIDALAHDPNRRHELGAAGNAAVAGLTWEAAMDHLAAIVTTADHARPDRAARVRMP